MSYVNLNPDNDPGGVTGEVLHALAGDFNDYFSRHAALGGQIELVAAAQGEPIFVDPTIAEAAAEAEAGLNFVGGLYKVVQEVRAWVVALTPEEFAEATPGLEAFAPGYDWADFYERNRLREPGKVGKAIRPVLRILGVSSLPIGPKKIKAKGR
ncbi:MAG TPA: hypothetical protein VFB59_05160 [Candidatus Saccharimonadales bacterium]|nr:hypothetical protein [Candidatus Saccharimonadales bacterium]